MVAEAKVTTQFLLSPPPLQRCHNWGALLPRYVFWELFWKCFPE